MVLLCFIQAVKLAALMENFGFRRVQVLRHAIAQYAAAEGDHAPAFVADGEHHPFAETVVRTPLIVSHQHAGIVQCAARVGVAAETLQGVVPSRRREADGEMANNVVT